MKLRDPYEFMGNGQRFLASIFYFILGVPAAVAMCIDGKHTLIGWIWGLFWIAAALEAQGTLQRTGVPGRCIGWALHFGFIVLFIGMLGLVGFLIFQYFK